MFDTESNTKIWFYHDRATHRDCGLGYFGGGRARLDQSIEQINRGRDTGSPDSEQLISLLIVTQPGLLPMDDKRCESQYQLTHRNP